MPSSAETDPEPGSQWNWLAAVVLVLALVAGVRSLVPPVASRQDATSVPAPTPAATAPVVDAARLAPSQSGDARRRGQAAYAAGDLTGALSQFEAAVAANPGDADARNNLAQVLVRENRVADALPHLDEAVQLEPARWAFRFNRARAYGLVGRWPDAVIEYQAAADLFPDDYATRYNLGLACLRIERYDDAIRELEQAVRLAPGEPSFLLSLGKAHAALQHTDRARAAFERFLALAPNDPEAPTVKSILAALSGRQ